MVIGSILGPYMVSTYAKSLDRPLIQYASDLNINITLNRNKPVYRDILIQQLLCLLPESLVYVLDSFEILHVGLFFIWKRYYDIVKRVL